jgi:type II secretory pathway component GspD/PulD (secretin)
VSRYRLLYFIVGIGLILGNAPMVQGEQASEPPRYRLHFIDMPLQDLVKAVATMTNKTFLLDPRVKTSEVVTLTSERSLSSSEVLDAFGYSLAERGLVVSVDRGVIKIVPSLGKKLRTQVTPRGRSGALSVT